MWAWLAGWLAGSTPQSETIDSNPGRQRCQSGPCANRLTAVGLTCYGQASVGSRQIMQLPNPERTRHSGLGRTFECCEKWML